MLHNAFVWKLDTPIPNDNNIEPYTFVMLPPPGHLAPPTPLTASIKIIICNSNTRTADYNSRHESYQNDTRGHQMGQKEEWKPKQSNKNYDA